MPDARTDKKARTRQAIMRSADRLLRTHGVDGTSVADVMKGAGLTVGGFYAHFPSKEALIAEALGETMTDMRGQLTDGLPENGDGKRLGAALTKYLSTIHRDHPELGCPLPATTGDLAEEDGSLRRALAQELERHMEALAEPDHREQALGALALMVGGLSLARATAGTDLSDEILQAARGLGLAALDCPGEKT